MSLIDQQKDLESFSDQALLQEASQPMRGYPPYLVMAEIQRRQEDRQRVQRQSQAQEPKQPPVATQQIQAFINQMQAPVAQPEAITADMGQMAGMGMAEPQMAPEQMQMAPEEAMMDQSGIMAGAPVQAMAGGGVVQRKQAGGGFFSDRSRPFGEALFSALTPRPSEAGLVRRIRELEAAGQDASALRAQLSKMKGRVSAPALGAGPTPTASSAPGIASLSPSPEITQGFTDAMAAYKGRDLMAAPQIQGVPVQSQKTALRPRPPAAPGASAPMAPSAPAAPAAAAAPADTYWSELMAKYGQYQPSEKEFERDRRAALLTSLGEVVGGATRRGDIAKGLAGITREQLAGKREFQKQMREYEMGLMGLRGQERAETRAETREAAAIARDDARFKAEMDVKIKELDMRRLALKEEAATRAQAARNDAERLAIQRRAADIDDQLLAARKDLLKAQAEYHRGKFTSALPFGGQGQFATAQDISAALEQ
jgi:hypothetical protein